MGHPVAVQPKHYGSGYKLRCPFFLAHLSHLYFGSKMKHRYVMNFSYLCVFWYVSKISIKWMFLICRYLLYIHPHEKVTVSFLILSIVFNLEYFSKFSTIYKNQGQFWNMLLMRILKLAFISIFDNELTKIFMVKDKPQNQKRYRYFFVWVYIKCLNIYS